jgi:hypothetical protein
MQEPPQILSEEVHISRDPRSSRGRRAIPDIFAKFTMLALLARLSRRVEQVAKGLA